jgi:hypothetical protein
VDRSNDYDRNADQQFERKGIDGEKPLDNFERNIPGSRRCQNVYEPNWNNQLSSVSSEMSSRSLRS